MAGTGGMTESEIAVQALLDPSVVGYLGAAVIVAAFVLNTGWQLHKMRSRK